jgi:hypothetical protein
MFNATIVDSDLDIVGHVIGARVVRNVNPKTGHSGLPIGLSGGEDDLSEDVEREA